MSLTKIDVTVDLAFGYAMDNWGQRDVLRNIEHVMTGTGLDDIITGNG